MKLKKQRFQVLSKSNVEITSGRELSWSYGRQRRRTIKGDSCDLKKVIPQPFVSSPASLDSFSSQKTSFQLITLLFNLNYHTTQIQSIDLLIVSVAVCLHMKKKIRDVPEFYLSRLLVIPAIFQPVFA